MDKKGSPIFMKMKEQGHGFIRKNKAGKVVSGIVLGATMFMAGQVASADEVKAPTDAKPVATATTETTKATTTEAPKQEVQAETKEAPKTEEVKDQAGLDKKYSDLKEKGKELDVELKEDKKVTHKTVADASKDLDEQGKKVEEVAKGRDEANAELQKVVKEAKALGIDVKLDDKVTYDDLDKAKEDIANQVKELSTLVTSVKEGKARLNKAVSTAQSVGVKFEGVKNIDLKEVADAEKTLNEVASQQKTVSAELNKAVADAKAKGVNVTVEGETVVDAKDAQKALADAKAKIAKALADAETKNKAIRANNAKVNEANKNAKAELVSGSTATKNADGTYTQTLAVKNEKAGSKWSGNLANTGSAEIVSVKLVSPSGKETVFANGKIDSSKALDEVGEYKLVYTFKAKDNTAGNISGKLNVEGQAEQKGKATGTVAFTTKAPTVTNKENQVAPLTITHVYDYSSSYAGKLKDSLLLSKKIIEANSPESKHIIVTYPGNYATTYEANISGDLKRSTDGVASKLLSKDQALSLIDKLLKINAPSEKNPTYTNYPDYSQGVADAFGDLRYKEANAKPDKFGRTVKPYEEIIESLTKPTDTISVIQYTDGWLDGESIDETFANWAKKRAKTFMSVLNRNQVTSEDTNGNKSIEQMKAVGHPNIYDMTGKDQEVAEKEIIKQFMETATVKTKTTKGENQTVKVMIGGNGVTVTKAVLKGATTKELAIKDGKVDFSEKLADGSWTVEFEATGNGKLTAVVSVDGKEVGKKDVDIKSTEGVKGSSVSKTDNINAVVFPKLPTFTPLTVENIVVLAKGVRLGDVETTIHPVTVEKELNPVTFKETVSPVKTVTPQDKKVLPNTGESNSSLVQAAGLGLGVVGLLGLAGATKKKEDQ